ncbi:unnamed protein product [Ectocarpus sp. 12 AP-2014]
MAAGARSMIRAHVRVFQSRCCSRGATAAQPIAAQREPRTTTIRAAQRTTAVDTLPTRDNSTAPRSLESEAVARAAASTAMRPRGPLSPPRRLLRSRPAEDGKRFVREAQRLGGQGKWGRVLSLLRQAEGDGAVVNHIMYNAAISALSKSGRWKEATSVLESMPGKGVAPDVVSYATAMEACRAAHGGRPDEAYGILSRMTARTGGKSVKPNGRCFNTVLAAFAKSGRSRQALSLVEVDMVNAGVEPDLRTWSTLIGAYRAAGESGRDAAKLLGRMRFNNCLNAASRRGEWELAFDLLEDMGEAGVEPNCWSYSAAMKAGVNAEEWTLVPALLRAMREAGSTAPPNVWNFNICLDAYGKSGEWEKAVSLLRKDMPASGVAPDVASYASAIDAAGKAGEWDTALALWDEARAALPPSALNSQAYSIAIGVCGKAGLVDRALSLLLESQAAAGLPPDLRPFNAAIDACARAGRWERALSLLREIEEAGLEPDVISFTSAIAAFRSWKAGAAAGVGERELGLALGLLEEMKSRGLPPTSFSHSAAIKLCTEANRHEQALELFEELKASGQAADEPAFTAIIDSCARHSGSSSGGGEGRWETAVGLLDEMEASGVAPSVAAFNGAIRACCNGGKWHMGSSLLRRMAAVDGVDPNVSSMNALIRGLS